jgi:nucleoid DNA-binding protein
MGKEAATKPPTKTEILTNVAEATGLTKKQVQAVFDAMTSEIGKAIGKKGPGAFTIPGLCKIVRQHKPALPRREVRNPATGQMVWADPKPARNVVKVRPLKALKDMV